MWIIYITLIAMLAMAKRRGGRKRAFRKYLRGSVDEGMDLGTLAAVDAISQIFGDTVNERSFVSSVVLRWSIRNFTKGANIGPILVGVAHSDYTAGEIEEWIENQDSWDEGNLVQQEVAKRKIRMVGTFDATVDASASLVLNDGKPIRTKCGWILLQGQSLQLWAFNQGSAALATTDPKVQCFGHANLWPR